MIRVEETFLLKELPKELKKCKKIEIEQGYISEASDPIRIRKRGDSYSVTRKIMAIPGNQSLREHLDIPIDKQDFDVLWKNVSRSLKKNRYYYSQTMDYEIRVDEFMGDLKGIYLIELIFADETARGNFESPAWFGRSVTKEDWASNSYLAGKTTSEIEPHLEGILPSEN